MSVLFDEYLRLEAQMLGLDATPESEGLYVGPHKFFNLAFSAESPAISVSTDGSVG